mgnify:CR=1 FL=1
MLEEDNICYICHQDIKDKDTISYCNCKGSLRYHKECMIKSINYYNDDKCRVCKYKFKYKKRTVIDNVINILKEIILDIKNLMSILSSSILILYFIILYSNHFILSPHYNEYNNFQKYLILNLIIFFEFVFIMNFGLYLLIFYHFSSGWYYSIKLRINNKKELIKKD